ncbi:hypothetical protein XENORESO_003915, partial [Xenotaenia resolanae]
SASTIKEASPNRNIMQGAKVNAVLAFSSFIPISSINTLTLFLFSAFINQESQEAVCSHLHHAVVCAAAHIPSDVSVFKLLWYLQSRVKQLQTEHQTFPDTLILMY